MTKRPREKFTNEFKAETLKLIKTSGRSVGSVARELNIGETIVCGWVQQADPSSWADSLNPDEHTDVQSLRKENRELWMKKGILRQEKAFFAKDSRGGSQSPTWRR